MHMECATQREAWLAAGDAAAAEVTAHLAGCPDCTAFVARAALDQRLLREHFARIPIPPPPALELRAPLEAASGHPRRTSLNLIPFLLALLLLLMLAIAALTLFLLRRAHAEGAEPSTRKAGVSIEWEGTGEMRSPSATRAPPATPRR